MTSIKYTANGFATEIGQVTPGHVKRARDVLDELNKLMDKDGTFDLEDKQFLKLNSSFFSLIPKPFSRKIATEDLIADAKKLDAEFDVLDQLATGVQMGAAMQQNTAARMNALGTDVEVLKDKEEVERVFAIVKAQREY